MDEKLLLIKIIMFLHEIKRKGGMKKLCQSRTVIAGSKLLVWVTVIRRALFHGASHAWTRGRLHALLVKVLAHLETLLPCPFKYPMLATIVFFSSLFLHWPLSIANRNSLSLFRLHPIPLIHSFALFLCFI
jgi:hypothetical protein